MIIVSVNFLVPVTSSRRSHFDFNNVCSLSTPVLEVASGHHIRALRVHVLRRLLRSVKSSKDSCKLPTHTLQAFLVGFFIAPCSQCVFLAINTCSFLLSAYYSDISAFNLGIVLIGFIYLLVDYNIDNFNFWCRFLKENINTRFILVIWKSKMNFLIQRPVKIA